MSSGTPGLGVRSVSSTVVIRTPADSQGPLEHRHSRQELLRPIGQGGQRRLRESHTLIIGCGALGTVSSELLARAGIGRLSIADRDVVEPSNLQRQTLFTEAHARAGLPKAEAAADQLRAIDSGLTVNALIEDVDARSIGRIIEKAGGAPDIVLDGTDNFATRYLLNDLCVREGIPFVYAGAVGTLASTLSVLPHRTPDSEPTPCLRCLFPEPPVPGSASASQTCDTVGVLGPATSTIASIQAAEAIKILVGDLGAVRRTMLSIDLWSNDIRQIDTRAAHDPECPCCARRQFVFLDSSRSPESVTLCGRSSVQISPPETIPLDLPALALRLEGAASIVSNRFLVRATLEGVAGDADAPIELTVFADGRAIVSGTTRPERARSIYDRFVGA